MLCAVINAPFGTNRYRIRSPKAVVAEIDHLHDTYGVKTYKIIDEMFVLNERHVTAFFDELIPRNYDLNIWAYARVDTVKSHMLRKMRQAGETAPISAMPRSSTILRRSLCRAICSI